MGLVERLGFRLRPQQELRREAHQEKKSHKKWANIDRYIVDALVPADPALNAALQSSEARKKGSPRRLRPVGGSAWRRPVPLSLDQTLSRSD
jgi:hypothetical protein